MTNDEKRADDRRRRHLRDSGIDPATALPWRMLQLSERRRWLRTDDTKPTGRGSTFTPASPEQRTAIRERRSIVSGEGPCDAAHLTPRSLGGCDDPLCTVPLTRVEHRAFDDGRLDLLPHLLAARCYDELAHMISAHDVDPVAMLNRLTGERWTPGA